MIPKEKDRYNVLVLDMQPIDPPVGGGRIRLLGLYYGLGLDLPTTYIGTYDWPGPGYRRHKLSETLEEIDIPLSARHFKVSEKWKTFAAGRTVIDTAFPLMAHLSGDFVDGIIAGVRRSDIVVISHPWVYPAVRKVLDDAKQVIVYDSHNFEGMLRAEILDDGGFGSEIVKHVITTEFELAHRADLILTCSEEDRALFKKIYSVPERKMLVVANGVYSKVLVPPISEEKEAAKKTLGLAGKTAIFIGSAYDPNVEAVKFICNNLAPLLAGVTFVICGGVCEAPEVLLMKKEGRENVRFAGYVEEKEKLKYLHAADLAVNPMFSGSGTNIKMFDFMSVGLPVVSTSVGARGIEVNHDPALLMSEERDFVDSINSVIMDDDMSRSLGERARALVEKKYSWESISPNLGVTLATALDEKRNGKVAGGGEEELARPTSISHENLGETAGAGTDRVGILTSWGVRCGIAEYSRHLVDALASKKVKCHIIANKEEDSGTYKTMEQGSSFLRVEHIWKYGQIKSKDIVRSCKRNNIANLNIQYHHGFYNEELLTEVVKQCLEAEIGVSVTLHNTRDLNVNCLKMLGGMGAKLLLHSDAERRRLVKAGVTGLLLIPFGVLEVLDESLSAAQERLGISNSPVVGCFGFLRPHKGLMEMIQATAILKDLFPDILLLGLNSLYPSEDSHKYLSECTECIAKLNLESNVRLITDFLAIEQVINDLHACDVVVLPYHHSNEGASASAHTVIASRRPLITTREDIFQEISDVVYNVENSEPSIIAAGVANVLSSPLLLKMLKEKSESCIRNNGWSSVANTYLGLTGEERAESWPR